MKSQYHREITVTVLSPHFSEPALAEIVRANLHQDRPRYQIGHDYIHFDGSAFEAGFAYIKEQQLLLLMKVKQGDFSAARRALGRITHAWQDFYSHSNYVRLWRAGHPDSPAEDIDPADPDIMAHEALISGKNYGLIEFLAMIPGLSSLIVPRMPADSHAKMNLDSPSAGPLFALNYQASLKHTYIIYQELLQALKSHGITQARQIAGFHGKAG